MSSIVANAPTEHTDAFGNQEMFVTKRNGKKEIISFDKILKRIKKVGKEIKINYTQLVMKIIDQLFDGIPTDKIDEISAEQCASMSSIHYDYGTLASRIAISNHHRNTSDSFSGTMKKLGAEGILNKQFLKVVHDNAKHLDSLCDYQRDYLIDYFGFKTLERSYLLSIRKRIYERPQMMFMRLAVAIHGNDMEKVEETYHALSNKLYIHGTPSLYNAGTKREQMSSCFVRGTRVRTVNRGMVEIQKMVRGDLVRTHTGEVQRVDQVHENPRGLRELYRLKFYGKPEIVATEDHPFYIYNSEANELDWMETETLYEQKDKSLYAQLDRYDPEEFPNIENDNDLNFESPYVIHHNGFHYVKLESVENVSKEYQDTLVYTLGIAEDHSYNVEGVIVKNCYLLAMEDDSIDGIFNTLKDCALISKYAGGIGLHIHNVRATGTHIAGTNGTSNGIVPMLRVFNHTAKYVDQCLDPETIVYTTRGPLEIRHIKIGDQVVAEDGQFYEIRKVLDNEYDGDMYHLKVKHAMDTIKLTDMHPLWSIQTDEHTNISNILPQLERNLLKPDFTEVKHLKYGDYIGFPIPKYEKDVVHYTEADCEFYGILIASGCYLNKDTCISLYKNKFYFKECLEFIESYLNDLSMKYKSANSSFPNLFNVQFERKSQFKFTKEMVHNTDVYKYVMSQFLHLPKYKIKRFLKGFLGSCGEIILDQNDKKYAILVKINSKNVLESLRYILMRLGILCWCDSNKKCPTCGAKPKENNYLLYIPCVETIAKLFPTKNVNDGIIPNLSYIEYDGYLFSPVKENTKKTEKQRVIDIEVDHEDHHNFLTESGLVKNGGGKRNGSFAIYLEPWHADIELYLQMRKNHGEEELKARDLFYALWIPDLFMKRMKENQKWSLFCPHECPGLADVYGEEFEALYTKYEKEGKARSTVQARDLWLKVLDAQMETGTPYLVYKDAANKKSNQKNLGTIKSSNLCVAPETMILTDRGYIPIGELKDQTVTVWNGEETSEVTVRQTSYDLGSELIEIHTSDGSKLSCTKYHKFYIKNQREGAEPGLKLEVEAKDLSIGDELIDWTPPVIDGDNEIKEAYLNGICVFNMDEYKDALLIPKTHTKILEHIPYIRSRKQLYVEYVDKIRKDVEKYLVEFDKSLLQKTEYGSGFVPNNHKMKSKMEWLSGLYDMNAVQSKNGFITINISYHDYAIRVKHMLQTCGVNPFLYEVEKYEYHLCLSRDDYLKLKKLGFSPKVVEVQDNTDILSDKNRITISKIVHAGRRDATYCFTEPKRHMGIFGGMITGQCSEIIEYSDANETAVCFTGDTQVLTKEGYMRIDECDGKEIYSHFETDELTKENPQFVISTLIDNGVKDVYELECYGRKPIKATENHLFAVKDFSIGTCRIYTWKKLCELTISDKLVYFDKETNKILNSTIHSIKYIGKERVYDLNVQNTHNFIAEGFVVHNCNLASIALPSYVKCREDGSTYYDFDELHKISKLATYNLNRIIDMNYYPTEKTRKSNMRHRPIGIGVQGLADTFFMMGHSFGDEGSMLLNRQIFETIYHGALEASCEIAKKDGPYETFQGSPASNGKLQFDLWDKMPLEGRYDWDSLKHDIMKHGIRNSLLLAPMPTASTSQILGFNECIEPITSNIYSRRTLAGEFIIVNRYLMRELIQLGLWNERMKNYIIANNGSIQGMDIIPKEVQEKYKTVWEIPMRSVIDMAADRGIYVDQSQSLNLWLEDPNYNTLTSMHFYSWSKGLKTGIYYLRRRAKHQAQKFTIEPEKAANGVVDEEEDEICEMCSS